MKQRMTITMSPQAAKLLDALARQARQTRSRTAEDLIRDGMRRRQERALDRLAERFFASPSTGEAAAEDAAWKRLSLEALADDD